MMDDKMPRPVLVRRLECPEELFGPGRYVVVFRVKLNTWLEIQALSPQGNPEDLMRFGEALGPIIADWNVVDPYSVDPKTGDPESGTVLLLPREDPRALGELTDEQIMWLFGELTPNPKNSQSSSTTAPEPTPR